MTNTFQIQEVSGTASAMQGSLKNNRNLINKRMHFFDMDSDEDYDGSRPFRI